MPPWFVLVGVVCVDVKHITCRKSNGVSPRSSTLLADAVSKSYPPFQATPFHGRKIGEVAPVLCERLCEHRAHTGLMARGQHIDREARYAATGMTVTQRKEYVRRLMNAGLTERQIAKKIGMSNSGTHYICAELKGRPRQTTRLVMCDSCWEDTKFQDLDGGLCPECRGCV